MKPFKDQQVARVFAAYPPEVRREMLTLREFVLRVAAATPGVGDIEETLKWGEPAYVTAQTGSGSTLRIDWKQKRPQQYAMYFHCQTNLIESFRNAFPDDFTFEGNRALIFDVGAPLPRDALALCIEAALTYRLRQRKRISAKAQHAA